MAKTTRARVPADRAAARPGYCSWHQGHDRAVRLVQVTADQGSGSGTPDHYACAPCRHAYDLTPVRGPAVTARKLPTVWQLTPGERRGENCVWCPRKLGDDAVYAGIAVGYWGAHNLSVGVYFCPDCATTGGTQ